MSLKTYEYSAFSITQAECGLKLNINDDKAASVERLQLFTSMLHYGYIPFYRGKFKITDKDIVRFWTDSCKIILKDMSVEQYYNILGLPIPYKDRIPSIKETETFNSPSYQLKVVWINDTNAGKMYVTPKAYDRKGLELVNFENKVLGSLYPEYYVLYELIEKQNSSWKSWSQAERVDFFKDLYTTCENRRFDLPRSLLQILEHFLPVR